MDLTVVALICFAAITFLAAAAGLLVRDLVASGGSASGGRLLGRLPLARDERPPRGIAGHIDASLERLVVESGLDWTSMAAALMFLAGGLLLGGVFWIWTQDLLATAIAGLLGTALPLPLLVYHRSRRIRMLRERMPDALDLIARAVRAGESLDQAIDLAGQKGAEPLATELRRCAKQLQMGLSMHAVMRALVFRVRLMEMRIFATTLAVHRQTGGNLATTLERMAAVIRERITYQRQVRAATAAGRFSAAMIATAGPLLFAYMFFFQYEYAGKLITLPLGQSLLVVAVALEIIGLMWIARMLKVD